MREYANYPERTKNAYSPDGRYYLTGDWAKYNKNLLFSYQGREDDLIKSRGYRIGPDEVEKAGMSHPAVAKIAVVGVKTELESSAVTVKAFILLKPEAVARDKLIQDIQNHIKRVTAPHKYPRLIEFLTLEEWSSYETTSGKIRRRALRERDESKLPDIKNTNPIFSLKN
jgi:acetyl-CoA synthetase